MPETAGICHLLQTPVELQYSGYSIGQIFCLHCPYRSVNFNTFNDLGINLQRNVSSLVEMDDQTEDITKLGKDPNAEGKKIANDAFMNLRTQLEIQLEQSHLNIGKIENLVFNTKLPQQVDSNILLPTPLSCHPPKSDIHKQESNYYLEDLLFNQYKESFLSNLDNGYICPNCKSKGTYDEKSIRFAVRKGYLYKPGRMLCLTLRRFKKSKDIMGDDYVKNNVKVIYPKELDMSPYAASKSILSIETQIGEEFKYELVGVVSHAGTLHSGHYTAFALHTVAGQPIWFYFSDGFYKQVEEKDALNNAHAFMLFYRGLQTGQASL